MTEEQNLRLSLSGTLVGHNTLTSRLLILLRQYNASLARVRSELDPLLTILENKSVQLANEGHTTEELADIDAEISAMSEIMSPVAKPLLPEPTFIELEGVIGGAKIKSPPISKPSGMPQPDGVYPSYMS